MKLSPKIRKAVAIFLLLNFAQQLFAPIVSLALTAGPTAPEFSSFEPVDTTDIVNLASGEFVYNTPILEVPGPEGGYPLSLSYHAGIKLDQEASWVGLGWTLNPGAINRSVNGFPDDNVESKRIVRDYWGGGEQTTRTFSVGLSIPNTGIGINYTRAKTTDTYKGFSSNDYMGLSFNPLSALGAVQGKFDVASDQRVKPVAAFREIQSTFLNDINAGTYIGASISSKGSASSIGIAGASLNLNQSNNLAGRISSFSKETEKGSFYHSFGSVSIKDFYTRYWSDEAQALTTYGTLYPGIANAKIENDYYETYDKEFNSYSFDTYDLYDDRFTSTLNSTTSEITEPNDLARHMGGTLPAYDRYEVLGQGIGGSMQPFIFENGDLFGQSIYERGLNGEPANKYPKLGYKTLRKFSDKKVDFRFLNDFSNTLSIAPAQISDTTPLSIEQHQVSAPDKGFNNNGKSQKLAGSRHIEWFTNEEIASGGAQAAGFIDFYSNRSDRKLSFSVYENYLQPEACLPYGSGIEYGKGRGSFKDDSYEGENVYKDLSSVKFPSLKPRQVDLKKKIGGFMITNQSGVTYHYALPVYNYNEYIRSKLKNPQKGAPTFREYKNDDPYAYTWLLTAITGPDYVDQDGNGTLSDKDLGYWVKFDYGRWADAYQWRSPHTGYITDIESEYETFSSGIKELYYLDAVETRTHKAVFIKSKRNDGRGVTSRLEGGSNPRQYTMHYKTSETGTEFANLQFSVSPVSTMKLDAIYLFDKDDLAALPFTKSTGAKYREATSETPYKYSFKVTQMTTSKNYPNLEASDFIPVTYHNGDKVYDDDITNVNGFREKALRVIEFSTDYSLAKGTPNSIGYFDDIKSTYSVECRPTPGTTCSLENDAFEWPLFTGPHCSYLSAWNLSSGGIRPNCCDESMNAFYSYAPLDRFAFSNVGNLCPQADADYKGNTLTYFHRGKLTLKSLRFLGKGGSALIPPTSFTYDLNPQYENQKYDEWDYYKSDYDPTVVGHTRKITGVSATQTHAWSLTSIQSPLGSSINIKYEAQQFGRSILNDFVTLSVETVYSVQGFSDRVKVKFKEKALDLNKFFQVGDKVDIKSLTVYVRSELGDVSHEIYRGNTSDVVTSVGNEEIELMSSELTKHATRTSELITLTEENGEYTRQTPVIPYVIAGFVKVKELATKYTGGIRVKSISVSDDINNNTKEYSYSTSNGNSSGVTSFIPFNQVSVQYPHIEYFDDVYINDNKKTIREMLENYRYAFQWITDDTYKDLLTFSREVPAPGSLYEQVTVKSKTNGIYLDQYSIHRFKVFDKDMIVREVLSHESQNVQKKTIILKNNSSDVGSILSITTYDQSGQPVMSTNYGYLSDADMKDYEESISNTNQGIIHQAFHKHVVLNKYKINVDWGNWFKKTDISVDVLSSEERAIVTKREDRTSVLTSVQQIDYKKGTTSSKENHAFDFYSGQVVKEVYTDSYGNRNCSEIIPAYTVKNGSTDVYPALGLKVYNVQNKNMLTQTALSYRYILDAKNLPAGLLSASLQTWSDQIPVLSMQSPQTGIWRKKASYRWNGQQALNSDGTYPYEDFSTNTFDWITEDATDNSKWEKTEELTFYDSYSHALEGKDVNGNYSSSKMDPRYERVIASTVNGAYNETAFSGTEYSSGNAADEGDVNHGDGNPTTLRSHTGKYSLLTGFNSRGFNYTLTSNKSKKYHASVWVYIPGEGETQPQLDKVQLRYTINGVTKEAHPILQKNKSKSWYLLNLDIDPKENDVKIECFNGSSRGVYFDDFRVHPLQASMTSYVYDQATGELAYILDANNIYTHFEYDAMGRLIRSTREQMNFDFGDGRESLKEDKITKEVIYNYHKNN